MDPYNARQDVIEKMLLEELEAQLHNSHICDGETDRSNISDNAYMSSEHSDQQKCDHVSTATDSDGDNMTASDDSDNVVKEGGCEEKNGQILNKLLPLVSCHRKHNIVIGKLRLTAYSENISSLADSLKLFITDDILN